MKREYPYGDGEVKLVSTEWLENNLDEQCLVLDVQPNVHDYIQEHIPGAIYMNESLLRVPLKGLPAQYVPEEVIERIFRRLGVRKDTPVVVYTGTGAFSGWGNGLEQTMVAYTFARFGHQNIYVVDGGLDKWKREGRELSQEFPEVVESDFTADTCRKYFVDYQEFKHLKDKENVVLLDARPPAVYEGQGPWIKAGHIPGAVNLPWKDLMDENNARLLKPKEEIQEILTSLNITPENTIICSCGTGREATNEFLLFNWYLNYPKVKIYEGSFTEWSSYPDNPTVVGKKPR